MDNVQPPSPLSGTDQPVPNRLFADLLTSSPPAGPTAGWKTTEFWVSILSIIGVFVLILAGKLDVQTGLIVLASIVPGYAISRGLTKQGAGPLILMLAAILCLGTGGCTGPSGSPFTSATAPAAGKIPVKVVIGTQASGNTADQAHGTDYSVSGQVVFGHTEPWYRRVLHLFACGPLTPEDEARWDADLRTQAATTVPRIGVVRYPGEAP